MQVQTETTRLLARADVPSPSDDFITEIPESASHTLSSGDIARLQPVTREKG